MRIWKLVVLLAGVAGVIGFFTPLIDYRSHDGRITGDASAFQIARGVDGVGDVRAQAEALGLSRADSERIARAFHAGVEAYAGAIVACFVPAGLLAALGLLLMLRDRMGRLAGLCAIVLGGASAFGRVARPRRVPLARGRPGRRARRARRAGQPGPRLSRSAPSAGGR
jgi:hypothetical protein